MIFFITIPFSSIFTTSNAEELSLKDKLHNQEIQLDKSIDGDMGIKNKADTNGIVNTIKDRKYETSPDVNK